MGRFLIDSRLILCIFSALISLVVAVQFLAAFRRAAWRSPPIAGPDRNVRVAVIIPARNEQSDIAQTLQSVLKQEDVDLEVVVVNDHSTDQTGAIADRAADADWRVNVLHDPDLSPGWLGKCNAMQKGAALCSCDVLLFMDADITHHRRCFVTALAEMQRHELDLLSLFPRMRCISLWENAILPSLIGGVAMFATPEIENPDSADALAAGAFLMVNARVFHALGGFETIKHEMLDDVALAKLFKRNGRRVGFRLAPDFLSVRLYKSNHHAFWGMTKNILEGLGGRFWLAPAVILLPIFVFWTPPYCALAGAFEGDLLLVAVAAGTYALQYASIWFARRLFEIQPAKALFFPLVAIPVFCCMARALYLYTMHGAVEWRGRKIRVRGVRSPN